MKEQDFDMYATYVDKDDNFTEEVCGTITIKQDERLLSIEIDGVEYFPRM